ncbi:MAG: thiamine pyrophosphate-dependent enzyme [Thermomicrobiales bacterium]
MAQVAAPVREVQPVAGEGKRVMTGGQAMAATLKQAGIETIFGLPGVQLDGLFSALYDERDAIRVVHTRHEQATAYMADGYARSTGKTGVCLVVPGPGLLNAMAGLSTAYACNSPVLCLTGQIRSDLIGVGRGVLHEIPNQLEMVRSVTKHSARAMTPGEIPATVHEALRALRSGRIRPVEVEVPPDVFFAEGDVELLPPIEPPARPAGDPDRLDRIARLLGKAKQPIIYAGGGIHNAEAWTALLALAELLQAPVVMTRNGKGAISDRHYLAQGPIAEKELRNSADVMLAVGTRFLDWNESAREFLPGQTPIRIDIDAEELFRTYDNQITLEADAKSALAALIDRVGNYSARRPSRESELSELKRGITERVNGVRPHADFGLAIRAELPDEGIVVSEMTQVGYWAHVGFPTYRPRTYISPGYQGTLGYGFTTGLGAKVGNPNTPVVSINGDGGFGFTLNELSTAAQHNIAAVTIVFNDNAFGNVKRIQEVDLGGKLLASELHNPDYLKLADAFGVRGARAESPDALRGALREAIKADEPSLIEVPVGPMINHWRQLGLR